MSFVPQHIGVFSTSSRVPFEDVSKMTAAVQKQLVTDYVPIWGRTTLITAYPDLKSIPSHVWTAQIMDDVGEPGALGFHSDSNNQPFARIDVNDETSVTLSHEVLEMATDPYGNRLIPALLHGKRVRILCEVCDPNEAETYIIDGVAVSNFYRPEYFDDNAHPNLTYDFIGSLKTPMTLMPGGYISYMLNDQWHQDTWFGGVVPVTRTLTGMNRRPDQSLRSMIDEYMRANNWETTI